MPVLTARTIPSLPTHILKELQTIGFLLNHDEVQGRTEFKAIRIFGGFVWGNAIFHELLKGAWSDWQAPSSLDPVQQDRVNRGETGAVYREIALELLQTLIGEMRRIGEGELAGLLAIVVIDGVGGSQ